MTKAQYSLLEGFGMGLAEVRIAELQRAVMAAVSVIPFRSVKGMEEYAPEESITHIIRLSARVAALEQALRELSSIGFAASEAGCEQELIVQRLIGGQDAKS